MQVSCVLTSDYLLQCLVIVSPELLFTVSRVSSYPICPKEMRMMQDERVWGLNQTEKLGAVADKLAGH